MAKSSSDGFFSPTEPEPKISEKHPCRGCGKPAQRWNGDIQYHYIKDGKLVEAPKRQYICYDCDPGHNWFDMEE